MGDFGDLAVNGWTAFLGEPSLLIFGKIIGALGDFGVLEVNFLPLGDFEVAVDDFLVDFVPLPEGVFDFLGDFRGFLLPKREPADFLLLDEVSRVVGRAFFEGDPELETVVADKLGGVTKESRLA